VSVRGDGAVEEQPALSFAGLLRRLRNEARLTQEELAEASGVSLRSVSDLERGINLKARKDTALFLADALGLAEPVRGLFVTAARGRAPAAEVLAARDAMPAASAAVATRTLPRDIACFTGREPELRQLVVAVASAASAGGVVGIHAIGGMAGIGKTTLAVHAAHRLAPQFPDGQFFLPLHAHSPGQLPVEPAEALASLLLIAGTDAKQIPPGLEARAALWRDHLAGKRLLLLLDDAVGHEQVRPLLPGTAGSLVLVTSRRHLTALEDAHAISLDIPPPGEAAELLIRLAARPGLDPRDTAVGEITRLCGYLPLAVGMLARQLHHHPAWTPAGLAAELAVARDRLELMSAENLSVAAAFDLSYQDLTVSQKQLFRRLGLHPGTDIDAYAAAALDGADLGGTRRRLDSLYDQHLITEPASGRFRLHDLIREHARTLAAADPAADSDAALGRLLDYYLHTARTANQHLALRAASARHVPAITLADAPPMPTRQDAVTWMDADRLNLHAAAGYAATHGRPGHVIAIAVAMDGYLRGGGHYDQAFSLYNVALEVARRDGDQFAEADALNLLGALQRLTGDYPAATATLTKARELSRDLGATDWESYAMNQLGVLRYLTGDYPAATADFTRALELNRDLGNWRGEASNLIQLGAVQQAAGDYPAAIATLTLALELNRDNGDRLGEVNARSYLGAAQHATGDYPAATATLSRALELVRGLSNTLAEVNVRMYLGGVQLATGDCSAATVTLSVALELVCGLGNALAEANVRSYLGAVQLATGDHPAATATFTRALEMYRALGDRLGEAEVLNSTGELALAAAASADARACHEDALSIATGIAAPLEQARALEGIGRSQLQTGQPGPGTARLREALAIYLRIGSAGAKRVRQTLSDLAS
jgi:tetratricopeptide (TPR) repeat protein/transcriptional regulator with XRE-family HTH domain